MRHVRGLLLRSACVGVIAACVDTSAGLGPAPKIVGLAVAPNPYSTLSFVVTFKGDAVDSARVLYQEPGGAVETTPFYRAQGDSLRIVALGLRQSTRYVSSVEARGQHGTANSDTLSFVTDSLPS